jgi:hypothetical protein
MPYRIDFQGAADAALERIVELGALDVEISPNREIAALMPDSIAPAEAARALGVENLAVSAALGRDEGSVWLLRPRPVEWAGSGSFHPTTYQGRWPRAASRPNRMSSD